MEIDRRRSLAWLLSGLATPAMIGVGARPALAQRPLFVSARGGPDGAAFVTGFDGTGARRFDLPLPGRGHAVVRRRGHDEVVVLARRPGTFAVVIDLAKAVEVGRLECGEGRHFYGHGVFSTDGRYLFTTENDYDRGGGAIGIRDATRGYRQVGEFPSHEVGPHDLRLLSDGRTLVVANGGIMTHPDSGRAKLNTAEMSPALTYIDSRDGTLLGRFRLAPEFHQASIRHLALGKGDQVAIALQYQGPRGDLMPLVGLHDGRAPIRLLLAPEPVLRRMRNYCGGAAFDVSGEHLGVSCPRGNLVTFWRLRSGRLTDSIAGADGCGIAGTAAPGQFVVTSGAGSIYFYDALARRTTRIDFQATAQTLWDNHLTAVA